MNTDPTGSIAGPIGITASWSSRIASGAAEAQTTRSNSANQIIEDLLETNDREPDGRQAEPPPSKPDTPPSGAGNRPLDLTTGSLLDWKG